MKTADVVAKGREFHATNHDHAQTQHVKSVEFRLAHSLVDCSLEQDAWYTSDPLKSNYLENKKNVVLTLPMISGLTSTVNRMREGAMTAVVFGAGFGIVIVLYIAVVVIEIVGVWMVFTKAGQPG